MRGMGRSQCRNAAQMGHVRIQRSQGQGNDPTHGKAYGNDYIVVLGQRGKALFGTGQPIRKKTAPEIRYAKAVAG